MYSTWPTLFITYKHNFVFVVGQAISGQYAPPYPQENHVYPQQQQAPPQPQQQPVYMPAPPHQHPQNPALPNPLPPHILSVPQNIPILPIPAPPHIPVPPQEYPPPLEQAPPHPHGHDHPGPVPRPPKRPRKQPRRSGYGRKIKKHRKVTNCFDLLKIYLLVKLDFSSGILAVEF